MIQRPAMALAVVATSTTLCMSVLAGWQRGGTLPERAVWIAISIVLVVSAHLLPALVRHASVIVQATGAVLWGACMTAACTGHLLFFLFAQQHAAEVRASGLVDGPGVSVRALAPVMEERANVAHELAQARAQRCSRNCGSLEVRRVTLAAKLDALEAKAGDIRQQNAGHDRITTRHDALIADPVTTRLAALSGTTPARVDLLLSLGFAIVLEGVACLLWVLALRPSLTVPAPVANPDAQTGQDDVTWLAQAIADGELRPTVVGIRNYLGCSQARAIALRRQVVTPGSAS
ncbi:hypothetical protein ACFPTO_18515 [Paraburkholderia denitrificans]|uniref:DUF4407 domain-containing protein n=1 Tax=Paraburkholderia denitrificans TaxID=694025 RepID=A0ABW0JCY4_9BURK